MRDPYLYPHTDVLKNKADIRDRELFMLMESDATLMRLAELADGRTVKKFDFENLCQMHHHIFQDVFDWAGKPRIINITKSEPVLSGLSIEYSDCFDIARDAHAVLNDMNHFAWHQASFEEVVKNYSSYMAALWKVHPFREGNTRTVVTFCNYFMKSKGFSIDVSLYKDNAEYVRTALVAANAILSGIGDKRKPEYLEQIVADSLEDGWKKMQGKSVLGKLKENQDKVKSASTNADLDKVKATKVLQDNREK